MDELTRFVKEYPAIDKDRANQPFHDSTNWPESFKNINEIYRFYFYLFATTYSALPASATLHVDVINQLIFSISHIYGIIIEKSTSDGMLELEIGKILEELHACNAIEKKENDLFLQDILYRLKMMQRSLILANKKGFFLYTFCANLGDATSNLSETLTNYLIVQVKRLWLATDNEQLDRCRNDIVTALQQSHNAYNNEAFDTFDYYFEQIFRTSSPRA